MTTAYCEKHGINLEESKPCTTCENVKRMKMVTIKIKFNSDELGDYASMEAKVKGKVAHASMNHDANCEQEYLDSEDFESLLKEVLSILRSA